MITASFQDEILSQARSHFEEEVTVNKMKPNRASQIFQFQKLPRLKTAAFAFVAMHSSTFLMITASFQDEILNQARSHFEEEVTVNKMKTNRASQIFQFQKLPRLKTAAFPLVAMHSCSF